MHSGRGWGKTFWKDQYMHFHHIHLFTYSFPFCKIRDLLVWFSWASVLWTQMWTGNCCMLVDLALNYWFSWPRHTLFSPTYVFITFICSHIHFLSVRSGTMKGAFLLFLNKCCHYRWKGILHPAQNMNLSRVIRIFSKVESLHLEKCWLLFKHPMT